MAKRKTEQPSNQPEKLKRVTRLPSAPLRCPVCDVTLRPDTLAVHYQQELDRVQTIPPPPRPRRRTGSQVGGASSRRRSEQSLAERAQTALDSVRRRRFIFEHGSEMTVPPSTCTVCGIVLPVDQEAASSHVASCLTERGEESSGEEESYEEYTWCNVTRVRATSLLSPQARAEMFNGTVMSSVADTSIEVDVVADDTTTYGPPQYSENHIQECVGCEDVSNAECDQKKGGKEEELTKQSDPTPISSVQCLICMGGYTEPLVSVICWHVYCERCWLQALKAQKLCPKCKRITCAGDLRRIFL